MTWVQVLDFGFSVLRIIGLGQGSWFFPDFWILGFFGFTDLDFLVFFGRLDFGFSDFWTFGFLKDRIWFFSDYWFLYSLIRLTESTRSKV